MQPASTPGAFGNFSQTAKHYVNIIVRCVAGPKILLVDSEVARFLNVTFTHSQLLMHEVFVVDELRKMDRVPMKHFHCVIFVRPTQDNFAAVTAELELGNFRDYRLFFTNMFSIDQMQFLVRSDIFGKVMHCEEVYLDMFPVTDETCIIPLAAASSSTASLSSSSTATGTGSLMLRNPMTIQQWDNNDFVRVTEGIVAMALASARRPHIRYRANNRVCSHIASALGSRARNLHHRFFDLPGRDTVILILDRFDDPVTPLVTPWTYQALCHELLGIEQGIVTTVQNVRKPVPNNSNNNTPTTDQPQTPAAATAPQQPPGTAAAATGQPPQSQQQTFITVQERMPHVLSTESDSFFRAHRDDVWGELCIATKDLVDAFLELNKIDLRTKSLAEIGAIKDRMPEMRQQNQLAERHSTIVSEMGEIIKARQLSNISVLEQDLVCGAGPNLLGGDSSFVSYSRRFVEAIGDRARVSDADALRLAILFELRHEARRDPTVSNSIRAHLQARKVDVRLLDAMLQLGGQRVRAAGALFPQDAKKSGTRAARDIFQSFAKVLKEFSGDDAVSAVSVRHTPHMQTILAAAAKGTLSETAFPYYGDPGSSSSGAAGAAAPPPTAATPGAADEGQALQQRGGAVVRPREIIVFMVGGLTYAESLLAKKINEATEAAELGHPSRYVSQRKATNNTAAGGSKNNSDNDSDGDDQPRSDRLPQELVGCRVFLGSTAMLTSRSFLGGLPPLS